MNDSLPVDARHCVRERIVRAFLIEEQKCVQQVRVQSYYTDPEHACTCRQVLAEKLSQAKEKEGGKKKGKK